MSEGAEIVKRLLAAKTDQGDSVADAFGGRLVGANKPRPQAVFDYLKPCWVMPLLEAIVETDMRLRINIDPGPDAPWHCRAIVEPDRIIA